MEIKENVVDIIEELFALQEKSKHDFFDKYGDDITDIIGWTFPNVDSDITHSNKDFHAGDYVVIVGGIAARLDMIVHKNNKGFVLQSGKTFPLSRVKQMGNNTYTLRIATDDEVFKYNKKSECFHAFGNLGLAEKELKEIASKR